MTRTEDASVRTVVVAVAANLLVAVAKGVAAARHLDLGEYVAVSSSGCS